MLKLESTRDGWQKRENLMKKLEDLAVKFLQNDEYRLKIRKAGIFRFLEEYRFRQHSHEEYEINYINTGQAVMKIEGHEVTIHQGQCVVIPPHKNHSFRVVSRTGCKLTQLEMSLEMKNQDEEFLRKDGKVQDYYIIKNCDEIAPLIERIARVFRKEETEHNEFLMKISAIEMMIILNYYINQDETKYSFRVTSGLKQAVAWIQEHFDEAVNLEKVAENAGISSRYLRKYFSEVMGKTCIQYITELRMEKAKHLLWETNKSILDIAIETGYENAQYFSRVFRRSEGITPQKYRMMWREEES